jgi:hypothetical protein
MHITERKILTSSSINTHILQIYVLLFYVLLSTYFNPLKPSGNYLYHTYINNKNAAFCIYEFRTTVTVNSDYFLKQR